MMINRNRDAMICSFESLIIGSAAIEVSREVRREAKDNGNVCNVSTANRAQHVVSAYILHTYSARCQGISRRV